MPGRGRLRWCSRDADTRPLLPKPGFRGNHEADEDGALRSEHEPIRSGIFLAGDIPKPGITQQFSGNQLPDQRACPKQGEQILSDGAHGLCAAQAHPTIGQPASGFGRNPKRPVMTAGFVSRRAQPLSLRARSCPGCRAGRRRKSCSCRGSAAPSGASRSRPAAGAPRDRPACRSRRR